MKTLSREASNIDSLSVLTGGHLHSFTQQDPEFQNSSLHVSCRPVPSPFRSGPSKLVARHATTHPSLDCCSKATDPCFRLHPRLCMSVLMFVGSWPTIGFLSKFLIHFASFHFARLHTPGNLSSSTDHLPHPRIRAQLQ